MTQLQIKRGNKSDIPILKAGEPAFCMDTKEFYIGNGVANTKINEDARVGDLKTLTTTNKTTSVGAINELNTQVASNRAKIDNLEIGGRNLIIEKDLTDGYIDSTNGTVHDGTTGQKDFYTKSFIPVLKDEKYTFTVYPNPSITYVPNVYVHFYNSNKQWIKAFGATSTADKGAKETVTIPDNGFVRVSARGLGDYKHKFERGSVSTDWTPAPEDVDFKVDNIKIGGRNLIINHEWSDGYYNTGTGEIVTGKTGSYDGYMINKIDVAENEEYIFTVYKSKENSPAYTGQIRMVMAFWDSGNKFLANKLKYFECNPAQLPATIKLKVENGISKMALAHTGWGIYPSKLEKGNIYTDYTESPEDISRKINNIKVGGRNLLLNSGFTYKNPMEHWSNSSATNVSVINSDIAISKKAVQFTTTVNFGGVYQAFDSKGFKAGDYYALSGKVRCITRDASAFQVALEGSSVVSISKMDLPTKDTWYKFEVSGKLEKDTHVAIFYSTDMNGHPATTFQLCDLKLETGIVNTDYTEAPEDIELYIGGKANLTHTHTSNDITNLDASKLTGTIDIARIPALAMPNLVTVTALADMLKLTNHQIRKGDTVKLTSTNELYIVVDDTKLNVIEGYESYTAHVDWHSMTNKPTTASGYGITDVVTTSVLNSKVGDIATLATTNKTNVVSAINEVNAKIRPVIVENVLTSSSTTNALSANQGKVLKGEIGDLNTLHTIHKDSVVSAINEIGSALPHAINPDTFNGTDIQKIQQAMDYSIKNNFMDIVISRTYNLTGGTLTFNKKGEFPRQSLKFVNNGGMLVKYDAGAMFKGDTFPTGEIQFRGMTFLGGWSSEHNNANTICFDMSELIRINTVQCYFRDFGNVYHSSEGKFIQTLKSNSDTFVHCDKVVECDHGWDITFLNGLCEGDGNYFLKQTPESDRLLNQVNISGTTIENIKQWVMEINGVQGMNVSGCYMEDNANWFRVHGFGFRGTSFSGNFITNMTKGDNFLFYTHAGSGLCEVALTGNHIEGANGHAFGLGWGYVLTVYAMANNFSGGTNWGQLKKFKDVGTGQQS